MIFNPLLVNALDAQVEGTINERPRDTGFQSDELKCIAYTVNGLLAAGQDGLVRLLSWSEMRPSLAMGVVAPSRLSTHSAAHSVATPVFNSLVKQMMVGKLTEISKLMHSTDVSSISNLAMNSSHNKMIITRSTGQIQVYDIGRENETLKRVKLWRSENSSIHPYVGIGTVTRNGLTYAVVS